MIKSSWGVLFVLLLVACTPAQQQPAKTQGLPPEVMEMTDELQGIEWFGHSTFKVTTSEKSILFIDPFEIKSYDGGPADVVFITHAHFDHFSPDDLKKVTGEDTVYVAVKDVASQLGAPQDKVIAVVPSEHHTANGIEIDTIPAYNTLLERLSYHPKENQWVGYILNIDGRKIYYAGDTDFIEEMRELPQLDVAFLPIGGTFTMDVEEAIVAANAIGAKVTVPIHYRRILKDKAEEAEQVFKRGVTNSKVVIMEEVA